MTNWPEIDMQGSPADVPGFLVGHAQDERGPTGCTVVLCPEGAVGGVAIGGWAAGTRGMDGLGPGHVVRTVQGVLFTGGSSFGLAASDGVLRWLVERGLGNQSGPYRLPSLPAAVIFDLGLTGGRVIPGPEMGRQACENASAGSMARGNVGAGCGASIGKLFGPSRACKGGLGGASLRVGDLRLGALAVVNAFGDVIDHEGRIIAGARLAPDSAGFVDAARHFMAGGAYQPVAPPQNTTLVAIAANARLDKTAAGKVAAVAQSGLARCIDPVHSEVDGDLVCVLARGEVEADPIGLGVMAGRLAQLAVWDATLAARALPGLPAAVDLTPAPRLWPA